MIRITLTPEQVRAISNAPGEVEMVDGAGNRIGYVRPLFTRQEIAEAKRCAESNEERRTTAQVLERIRALETE
jgi:hypothetical protein